MEVCWEASGNNFTLTERGSKGHKHVCTQDLHMTVHSSYIHSSRNLKQPKCVLAGEWKNKCGTLNTGILIIRMKE